MAFYSDWKGGWVYQKILNVLGDILLLSNILILIMDKP